MRTNKTREVIFKDELFKYRYRDNGLQMPIIL